MRAAPLLLALALAACGGAASSTPVANTPVDQTSVTLGFTPPAVGDQWNDEQSQNIEIMISMNGKSSPMTQSSVERKHIEVLAVVDGVVTKAKYRYDAASKYQKFMGNEETQAEPHNGKAYILEVGELQAVTTESDSPSEAEVGSERKVEKSFGQPSRLSVTTESGSPSEAEVASVREAEKSFGQPDRMSKLVAGMTFKQDEPVDLPPDVVKAALDSSSSMSEASMTLTFKSREGDNARFAVKMTMQGDEQGNHVAVDLDGELVVSVASGQPLEMNLTGPFNMTGKVTATGTMTMAAHRSQ